MRYVIEKNNHKKAHETSAIFLRYFNVEYKSHFFSQKKYFDKMFDVSRMLKEKTDSFNSENFKKIFSLGDNIDLSQFSDNMKTVFGVLTEFKKADSGFVFTCNYVANNIDFLGLMWSSQITLMRLFGDLLIVDSVQNYHVINATVVDNNYGSKYGAIAISRSDSTAAYEKLFNFIKANVGVFIRPPKALLADGAAQIHNAFDNVFPGNHHIYCSFHLQKHISSLVY